jgi:hypothetical protein
MKKAFRLRSKTLILERNRKQSVIFNCRKRNLWKDQFPEIAKVHLIGKENYLPPASERG